MKSLINKALSAVSTIILFAAGCIMAGLGFAVIAALGVFALIAVGVALLASPFAGSMQPASDAPASDAPADTTASA